MPEGWAWERLTNLATFSGGKTPSTSKPEYWDGNVLWVTSKDMKKKYITTSQLQLSALGAEQMQLYYPDTLLLVTRSGILRHTLPVSILKECATINQDLKAIVLYMPQLAEYIYVCLKGMEEKILLKYTKSGTTVENVNFSEFQKILLPIAPIQEINRIITSTIKAEHIISYIGKEKTLLTECITKAKAKILDLAIRGKLVPQNSDDEPASVLLEHIRAEKEELIKQGKIKRDKKESIIFKGEDNSYYGFDLPDGWKWSSLKEITLSISDGSHNPPSNKGFGVPLLSAANVINNSILINDVSRWITNEEWEVENQRTHIEVGDVLLTIVGSIGRSAIVQTDKHFALQRSVAVIKPCLINSLYLMYILQAPQIQKWLNDNSKGTAQKGIYLNMLSLMTIPLPPVSEQSRIVDQISITYKQIDLISNALL